MEDNLISDTEKQWQVVGTSTSATQAQDRPGASLISKDLDADNNYGYDDAYAACTEFSMGSARKVTVDSTKYAEAQFTFAGTGFDLISLTSNTTGVIMVDVYDAEEFDKKAYDAEPVKTVVVDTYYGCTRNTDGEWVAAPDTENSLYQVPVAEVADLPYDTYTVVITAAYSKSLGHNNKASSYDFYLDAIRIYDPANDSVTDNDGIIKEAYKKDHEGWPSYIELRNKLIEAKSFGNTDADAELEGMVFIDGMAAVNSGSIRQYISYGPNNWDLLRLDPETFASRARAMHDYTLVNENDCAADLDEGVGCRAGSTAFWMTWDGRMLPCGKMPHPVEYPLETGFQAAWESIRAKTRALRMPAKCGSCPKRGACAVCAAVCVTETGHFDQVPRNDSSFSN